MSIVDSTFNSDGVPVVGTSRDMSYLYGLSDFFTYVFEDRDQLNLMLEANAYISSDIYSKFLQETSALSIETIQTYLGLSIKLFLLQETDLVENQEDFQPDANHVPGVKYLVKVPAASAKFLANRPFLPTEMLESGVDFRIEQRDEDSCYVTFAKQVDQYKFSIRKTSDGATQTAIWGTDVALDEQFVSKNFVPMLDIEPRVSTEYFTNLVYGLYYLYWNGPTTALMERGLNLALGVPLARATEEILDIRTYAATTQYLVITNQYQYLLPDKSTPSKNIGETLTQGEPLAMIVEVKDFTKDGVWWNDVSVPSYIVQHKPSSQIDRFAREGTAFDQMMKNGLKNHTFLVRIKNEALSFGTSVDEMFAILTRVKPSYTQSIFVNKIDLGEDIVPLVTDNNMTVNITNSILGAINFFAINDTTIN